VRFPNLEGAACIGSQPAEKVCDRCPARPECLAWALEHEKRDFWGGHSAASRKDLRQEFGIILVDA
jgi:hypothetical protein